MKVREGEFELDFSAAKSVEKLDDKARKMPQGMKLVDFVVEEEHRLILVEIKDPSCSTKGGTATAESALSKRRIDFAKQIQNDTLIAEQLTPKARDSYCYLHLMHRDSKPIVYLFLLGADKLSIDPALLLTVKDRLLARIRHEADHAWKRHYIADCLVLTEQSWADAFPKYSLARVLQ